MAVLVAFVTAHANPPKDTLTPLLRVESKNMPWMVTSVPPAVVPLAGTTEVTFGERLAEDSTRGEHDSFWALWGIHMGGPWRCADADEEEDGMEQLEMAESAKPA
mmetsp:Transcript_14901/g.34406  ORF Transcript_14901/g.34406 Transcript_14901/m.34406 type:complete len:105 (-) Transcript_14901:146-460(-)